MYTNAPIVDLCYNDRELLVYRILFGVVKIKTKEGTIKIYPPTKEDYLDACEIYFETMDRCQIAGIPDQDDMMEIMIEKQMWSWFEEKEIEENKKKVEDTKISCFHNRRDRMILNRLKNETRKLEFRHHELISKKNQYFNSTCEGVSSVEKITHLIKSCSYIDGNLYDYFKEGALPIEHAIHEYNKFHEIEDFVIRYLARNEPWRSIYNTRQKNGVSIFDNGNRELTINQKSLLSWSQMYDSVYESMECPDSYVIEDDDMLDGWFLTQSRKRSKEKAKEDFDDSIKNDKIKNSNEVYSIVKNRDDVARIESLNSVQAQMVKKQRQALINASKGPVEQGAFMDEKLKLAAKSSQAFKGKFKGNE
jgi:hypothetical protein